ncbi:MAG: CDF family Co(II)/Ni(II) efflux transporter DmeF [Bacteroidales bacterium]
MHKDNLQQWQHSHAFGQDRKTPGETRTIIVIAITATMMVVEISSGIIFGSMALLADGLHMASHAVALAINVFAYVYARRHAHDEKFSFGTGKVNALGGFTGAVLLAVFALMMAWESINRILDPVEIAFDQAILVAVIGLVVNGASVLILGYRHNHNHGHDGQYHPKHDGHKYTNYEPGDQQHKHDHNLRSAYLHVLADTLTSLLAIFALLAGKYIGVIWMDPAMGIVGAILVSKWSLGLLHATSAVLLDRQGPEYIQTQIRQSIEDDNNRVADLHLWSISPNMYGVIISVVTDDPKGPEHYKEMIPSNPGLAHVTVEVNECAKEHMKPDTLTNTR